MIDVIHAFLPNNMDPSEGFIETFIIASKNSFNLTTPVTSIKHAEGNIQYDYHFKSGLFNCTQKVKEKRSKNATQSVPSHCPCHENHKCSYRFFCGLCCDLFYESELQIKSNKIQLMFQNQV